MHFRGTANCMGDDFISCYENILEYVKLGDEAIKISDEKKAIVVIGLTRAGKSTLTQFVANASNPLTIDCKGTSCQLIDASGDGSDSVVSKTFVPNLVEDEFTNGMLTPFYDMPGFDDTRNISVEIANSFFIQKVIKNIEEIKILVVAKHSSFSSTETTFKTLVTFLTKFSKNPNKFRSSIMLISNFGSSMFDDAAHFYSIRDYLIAYNESMYGDESAHPDPIERTSATDWISCFIEAPTESPESLQKVAIFRSPVGPNGTSIRDIVAYQDDLSKMKDLIWKKTRYSPVSADEVGFTLSVEAELFLERATTQSATSIRSALTDFASRVTTYLQNITNIIAESPEDDAITKLRVHLNSFKNIKLDFCNSDAISSPRACKDQLELQLHNLANEMGDSVFQEINKITNFLQFNFEIIGNDKPYDMREWVNGFRGTYKELIDFIRIVADSTTATVVSRLDAFSIVAHDHYLYGFQLLGTEPIPEDLEQFNHTIDELVNLDFPACEDENAVSPEDCFKEIIRKLNRTIVVTENKLEEELNNAVKFLQFGSTILNSSLSLDNWVRQLISLKSKLERSLENENIPTRIFAIILNQLTELSRQIASEILRDIGGHDEINKLKHYLSEMRDETLSISKMLEAYNSRDSLAVYIDLILDAYSKLPQNFDISPNAIRQDVIILIERLRIFEWFTMQWIYFHRDNLHARIDVEWRVIDFLNQLFRDLETFQVQTDETRRLHLWREENHHLDDKNFDIFWTTFTDANINAMKNFAEIRDNISSHITEMEYSKNWLNTLLDYTLLRKESCPPESPESVTFTGSYITLGRIQECFKNYSTKPKRVIVLSENTFFFNVVFDERGLPENSKLFIMSRSFDFTQATYINLGGNQSDAPDPKPRVPSSPGRDGTRGQSGKDGANGSDFIGVYLVDKGSPSKLDVRSTGGNGQNGQEGGDGSNSADTSGPSPGWQKNKLIDENQCAAWDHGRIRMKLYPNSCNGYGEKWCNAGDDGVSINICGDEPGSPGLGGIGGSPGLGGHGGIKVILNVTNSSPSIQTLPSGEAGLAGVNGVRGNKGSWGAIEAKVDDVYNAGGAEKRCKLIEDIGTNKKCSESFKDLQYQGSDEQDSSSLALRARHTEANSTQLIPRLTTSYSLAEFKTSIAKLVSMARGNVNIFNKQYMLVFLNFVETNMVYW